MDEKKNTGMRIGLVIFLLNLVLSVVAFPMLPDRIITHWNAAGVADGYGSKLFGFLLMQLVSLFIFGLYFVIPRIDPQHKVKSSSAYFTDILNLLLAYFLFLNIIFMAQNLGYTFNMTSVLIPAVGVLMIFLGGILEKVEMNYFVGIRTPWTLNNEDVWIATHEKAGIVFKSSGVISLLGAILPRYGILLLLAPLLLSTIYLVVFSYTEHKRLESEK